MNRDNWVPQDIQRLDYEQRFAMLRDNAFGFIDSELSIDEKIIALLNLLPVAGEIVQEARETISRLRDENEALKSAKIEVRKKEISE